jgi:hypothetical protein
LLGEAQEMVIQMEIESKFIGPFAGFTNLKTYSLSLGLQVDK